MTSVVPLKLTAPDSVLVLPGLEIVKIVLTDPRPVPAKFSGPSNVSDALALDANPRAAATASPTLVLRFKYQAYPSK